MAVTTVQPGVSPEEMPGPAAELRIVLEPCEDGSLLEAPTLAAELTIILEPYSDSSPS